MGENKNRSQCQICGHSLKTHRAAKTGKHRVCSKYGCSCVMDIVRSDPKMVGFDPKMVEGANLAHIKIKEDLLRQNEEVNHPSHYTDGKIEVSDYISDKKLDFFLGNVIKYVSRAGKKDGQSVLKDLEKARWYLDRKIKMHGGESWNPHV